MILFKNATISAGITKERKVDILFDEKIVDVREDSINPPENTTVIDLDGKIVLPGGIDVHTHFRSEHPNWQNYFYNASKAAAMGGITFMADSSSNTQNPLTEGYDFSTIAKLYENNSLIDYGIWGIINSDDYPYYNEEISELSKNGVVGLEFYLYSNNDLISPLDYEEILELFTDFSNSQILFGVFPLDFPNFNKSKSADPNDISKYQFEAVKKLFRRSQETRVHLFNIVSAEIVDFVMNSTKKYHCSYDINPHYFLSNKESIYLPGVQESNYSLTIDSLIQTGKVPSISTDSGFINQDLNYTDEDFTGVVNYLDLQYTIPFLFSEYYLSKRMTLGNLERMLSGNPAKILGIDHLKGGFDKEKDADFIVIDPKLKYTDIDSYSSFKDREINCKVTQTYLRGVKIYDFLEGIQDQRGYGKLVKRDFQATTLNYY